MPLVLYLSSVAGNPATDEKSRCYYGRDGKSQQTTRGATSRMMKLPGSLMLRIFHGSTLSSSRHPSLFSPLPTSSLNPPSQQLIRFPAQFPSLTCDAVLLAIYASGRTIKLCSGSCARSCVRSCGVPGCLLLICHQPCGILRAYLNIRLRRIGQFVTPRFL